MRDLIGEVFSLKTHCWGENKRHHIVVAGLVRDGVVSQQVCNCVDP